MKTFNLLGIKITYYKKSQRPKWQKFSNLQIK